MSIQGNNLLGRDDSALYHPLVMEWSNVIEQYTVRANEGPYWYTEMADVSLLLAAAWRSGWVGITEFQTEKRKEDKEVHGRGDLWLKKDDVQVYLEAKSGLFCGDDTDTFTQKVLARIKDANNDCASSRAGSRTSKYTKYISATFIGVKFKFTPELDLNETVRAFLESIDDTLLQNYACAWSFPLNADAKYVTKKQDDDAYLYPGVLLILDRG